MTPDSGSSPFGVVSPEHVAPFQLREPVIAGRHSPVCTRLLTDYYQTIATHEVHDGP